MRPRPTLAGAWCWLLAAPALASPLQAFHPQSALDPRGASAQAIAWLWWWMLAAAIAVVLLLVVIAALGVWRGRQRGDHALSPAASRNFVIAGGVVLPLVAVVVLVVASLSVGTRVVAGGDARGEPVTIEVTGRQWWWQVHYLDVDGAPLAVTANEIHVPVGRPIELRLRASDVIHSFWVPNLQGKTDMVPGRTTTSRLVADAPGVYRGQCAEFCGVQHARMAFELVAEREADFARWLDRQRAPAAVPQQGVAAQGRAVFARHCASCHLVRESAELDATSRLGPDLTHIASRRTLAAATLPNTLGHLGGWVADPQSAKPGNQMPAVPLPADELNAVLAYLQTLR